MMYYRSCLLLFGILLLLSSKSDAWRRRRRRRCATHSCTWHWGPCSRSCGGGTRSPIKTGNQGACGSCNMPGSSQRCNTQCCPRNCYWHSWGSWSSCSRNCGTGTQSRSRGRSMQSCGGRGCSGSSSESRQCNTQCCPVHCSWGGWGSWTSCSASCGGGTRTRTRGFSPAPSCGGNSCPGSSSQSGSCNGNCCPVNCKWESWSGWSACSRGCGGGIQSRSRGFAVAKSCGGSACNGPSSDTRSCNNQCCPVHCAWGAWQSWSSCTKVCGGGTRTRTRGYSPAAACGGISCTGSSSASEGCNQFCCPVDCQWAPWTSWSACSRNCGGGTQTRSRGYAVEKSCGGRICDGQSSDSRACNTQCCPVHCSWDTWMSWGTCTVTCGGGTRTRSRVHAVVASCGGNSCSGLSDESGTCNSQCCPVNCAWSVWKSWSSCTKSCGNGTRVRSRTQSPAPSCGGSACEGSSTESGLCNQQCCPVDCVWSQWQDWRDCSVSCGGGIKFRSRSYAVEQFCNGDQCVGERRENQTCNDVCCPIDCQWTTWDDWGQCSATCGEGMQSRLRGENPVSYCGGKQCIGSGSESRSCNLNCCPVDCRWGEWSPWKDCSVSCGGGRQSRNREIEIPAFCQGAQCLGPSSDEQTCNSQCCPVNCEWNEWSQWSSCSKTCEKGTQSRIRTVGTLLSCGGNPCDGNNTQIRFCNDVCCPVHCKWSDWSLWTECTKTCASGFQSRQREVEIPSICNGEECAGSKTESKTCNTHCCPVNCVLFDWSTWSECSKTCGANGSRTRTRDVQQPSVCGGTPCSNNLIENEVCNRICFNGGNVTGNQCQCGLGWKGECCQEDVNECISVSCMSDATCFNSLGSFECVCNQGFTKSGDACLDIDECRLELHDCHKKAECINKNGHYICKCDVGFTGNGSICVDVNECSYEDYEDTINDFDYVSSNWTSNSNIPSPLCHDEAECSNTYGSYECSCNAGFSGNGVDCRDIDECASQDITRTPAVDGELVDSLSCHLNATCYNIPGSYYCFCKSGYFGDGKQCTEINECESSPCLNGGKCFDALLNFTCECSIGFAGEFCEADIDECLSGARFNTTRSDLMNFSEDEEIVNPSICDTQATCSNTHGSFQCNCNLGYSGDGFSCSDIDECEYLELKEQEESGYSSGATAFPGCDVSADCVNVAGNYDCKCRDGYSGSGFECYEIDECLSNPCQNDGNCTDYLQQFKCNCASGFRGDFCEIDIHECNDGQHECHSEHGQCINTVGSYLCVCKDGFSGDGKYCTDINECSLGFQTCSQENTMCVNTKGSYSCPCRNGFHRVQGKCIDMDECTIGNHECTGIHEICANTEGSYECECRKSFVKIDGECGEPTPPPFEYQEAKSNGVLDTLKTSLKEPKSIVLVAATVGLLIITIGLLLRVIIRRRVIPTPSERFNGPYTRRLSSDEVAL